MNALDKLNEAVTALLRIADALECIEARIKHEPCRVGCSYRDDRPIPVDVVNVSAEGGE